jgi:hypothetical protein
MSDEETGFLDLAIAGDFNRHDQLGAGGEFGTSLAQGG